MIQPGQNHKLTFLRKVPDGLILGDEKSDSDDEVLLPLKYAPDEMTRGEEIDVFVYNGRGGVIMATTETPKIKLHEYQLLQVVDVNDTGAFLNWGLDKDLMVPFNEQSERMRVGQYYLVFLDIDKLTNRLYATSKIDRRLNNDELTVSEGDRVELVVYRESDLGYVVIVNGVHEGLVFESDVYIAMPIGDKIQGYIKKIRPDNKLDISIQPIGYRKSNVQNSEDLYEAIVAQGGFIPLTDKSPPDEIYDNFGISKKAFKRAVGDLYKNRRITIEPGGIRLVK